MESKEIKAVSDLFFQELLEHIISLRDVPKVQLERVIGPVIGFFIEDIASALLDGDEIVNLGAEFPLKKAKNLQSTNIDWLLFNKSRDELVFFELKTSVSSYSDKQFQTYRTWSSREKAPWTELKNNYDAIAENGHAKYQKAKQLLDLAEKGLPKIKGAKASIVYLIPTGKFPSGKHPIEEKENEHFFSFRNLATKVSENFQSRKWSEFSGPLMMLCQKLQELDIENQDARVERSLNYSGRETGLADIVKRARQHGDEITVGFTGGISLLASSLPDGLKNRLFLWDWTDYTRAAAGKKDGRNWLSGSIFLEIVEEIIPNI